MGERHCQPTLRASSLYLHVPPVKNVILRYLCGTVVVYLCSAPKSGAPPSTPLRGGYSV